MKNKNKGLLLFVLCIFIFTGQSYSTNKLETTTTRNWLIGQLDFALGKILQNISPSDGEPGAVLASTSTHQPNYHYHWVRDAGLILESLIALYETNPSTKIKNVLEQTFTDYLNFSTKIQNVKTIAGLGEPKFNVDGTAFNEPWGRPQHDAPAFRAISLIHWANILIKQGKLEFVNKKMYSADMPATSPIKMDLEYLANNWRESSFDIWEEVKGRHFYTLMLERRALLEGAALAKKLDDHGAAKWYLKQVKEMEVELKKFWNYDQQLIVPTIERDGGIDYKNSNIDCSVILALLQGDRRDGLFAWNDPLVVSTLQKTSQAFANLYPINQNNDIPGVAIGRYPEDRYDGNNFAGGNPWTLCTLAMAQSLYRYAGLEIEQGNISEANKILAQADKFVERIKYHAEQDGSLSEQIDKNTGGMTSAANLTWNYSAILDTRHSVLNRLPKKQQQQNG